MISFRKKNANVLAHWYALIDNFRYSTHEFYREVEDALQKRDVPGLKLSEVKYFESGVLSDKRIYLRMAREEFAFDICAAPFGQAYFFSVRFIEVPPISLIKLSLAAVVVGAVFRLIAPFLGLEIEGINRGLLVGAGILVLAVAYLWYDRKRRDSYYRYDTRLMYHTLVSEIVKKKVDEVTAKHGVKLLKSYEYSPILGELYKAKDIAPSPNEVKA